MVRALPYIPENITLPEGYICNKQWADECIMKLEDDVVGTVDMFHNKKTCRPCQRLYFARYIAQYKADNPEKFEQYKENQLEVRREKAARTRELRERRMMSPEERKARTQEKLERERIIRRMLRDVPTNELESLVPLIRGRTLMSGLEVRA